MDDMLLTPVVATAAYTDTSDNAVFTTRNVKTIRWDATSQTLKVYGQDLMATPGPFGYGAGQVNSVYPHALSSTLSPVSAFGSALGYQPGGSAVQYWPTVARRLVSAPSFSASQWTGGEMDYLEVNATSMRDHMDMPCAFAIDEDTMAEIPAWSYSIQPTHHGWQGLYSADTTGLTSASVAVQQCIHNTKNPHGDYRRVRGSLGQKIVHHITTGDILAGIGTTRPDPLGLLAITYFHRTPDTFRFRAWASRSVASGSGDPGPPSDARIGYYFFGAAYTGSAQDIYAPYARSGGMYTVGSFDYYGYTADITIDPSALSPPDGTVGFYMYALSSWLPYPFIFEHTLALNFPYCASPGIISPSVYFPGRGIKLGTLPT